MDNNQTKSSGLNKSLKLIFVYTVATLVPFLPL